MGNKYNNYIIIANEFLYMEEYMSSLESFEKALKFANNDKEKIDALYEMADLNIILKNYESALDNYRQILSLDENQPGAHYGLSISNDFLKGDFDFSIRHYHEAIKLDPSYDRAYYYLSSLYDKIGESEKAIEALKKCVELDPYDYTSLNIIAAIYESMEQNQKALIYAKKALEINPNFGDALFNMGVINKKLGNNREALKYYEKAQSEFLNPNLYLNMSAIYIEEGNFKKAEEILKEGLRSYPDSVNLHYNLACTYKNLDEISQALLELRNTINIDPKALTWAKKDDDLKDLIKFIKD